METQYAWIFSFLILNEVKRDNSYSLFTILTYVEGTLWKKQFIASFERRIIKGIIFKFHVSEYDHKKYSTFSYCYIGLGVGCSAKEAMVRWRLYGKMDVTW